MPIAHSSNQPQDRFISKPVLEKWFADAMALVEKEKVMTELIFNLDETMISGDEKKITVLTRRTPDGKVVRPVMEASPKLNEHFTAVFIICADGTYSTKIPVILPLKNLPPVQDRTI